MIKQHYKIVSLCLFATAVAIIIYRSWWFPFWKTVSTEGAKVVHQDVDTFPPPLIEKATVCGQNSLYMLFRLSGKPIDFEQLLAEVPPQPTGASMWQLQQASRRFGLPSRVYRCSLDQLISLSSRKPIIIHFWYRHKGEDGGHYYIVLKADKDHVDVIDGTTGQQYQFNVAFIEKHWDGYVLALLNTSWTLWESLLMVGAGFGLLWIIRPWRIVSKVLVRSSTLDTLVRS